MTPESVKAIEVFFSYAHKDEKLRNELEKHLAILKRKGFITTWHDRKITPGKERDYEINKYLDKAQIILLLISSDFLASDYCDSVEVKQALQRHGRGECRVIPVILRPVPWRDAAAFKHLHVLPTDGRPVTDWQNRDKAFVDIAEGIRIVVQEILESPVAKATDTQIEFEHQHADPHNSTMLSEEIKGLVEDSAASFEVDNSATNIPILTAQRVIDAWANVIKRAKQKSSMLAAYMAYYKVVGVEGSPEHPVVVIQTEKSAHYKYVKDENRTKDLEWSLEMEFCLPCSIYLVPPSMIPQGQAITIVEEESTTGDDNKTNLTVQKLTESWVNIIKRTKQKSPMLAAYLTFFRLVHVEGPAWKPVIFIQEEFGVPFEVRLIQPGRAAIQDA